MQRDGSLEMQHNKYLRRLDVDSARVLIHGKEHVRVGRFPGSYYTRTGKVSVLRSIYRECGNRKGVSLTLSKAQGFDVCTTTAGLSTLA